MKQMLQMILDEMNHELGHFPGTTLDKDSYSKFSDIYYDLTKQVVNRNAKAKSKEQLMRLTRLLCSFADSQFTALSNGRIIQAELSLDTPNRTLMHTDDDKSTNGTLTYG